jgi:hypothetical protein
MKIENTGPLRPRNLRRSSRAGEGAGGDFVSRLEGEEDSRVGELPSLSPLTALDNLFVLQEISDEEALQRKAYKRADSILNRLEELRLALLEGRLSHGTITQLQSLVQGEQKKVNHPQVAEILAEIELRARVELAKLEKMMGV